MRGVCRGLWSRSGVIVKLTLPPLGRKTRDDLFCEYAQYTGRRWVKHAAVDSALGADSIVQCVPAVSTTHRARACLHQISWRDGRPGSRSTALNSVSSP